MNQSLSQHGGGGRAVAGDVVGLGGHFLGELGTEILVRISQLHLLGDGHPVVGDGGSTVLLVKHDVAALGPQRHLDGIGEGVHATLERAASILVEQELLGHELTPHFTTTARMSRALSSR